MAFVMNGVKKEIKKFHSQLELVAVYEVSKVPARWCGYHNVPSPIAFALYLVG